MPSHPTVAPGEPAETHFPDDWRAARARALQLPLTERAPFLELLDSVESGWPHVRSLQNLHDQHRPAATGAFSHVLDFIDDHVCDLFRDVALNVAVFIPVPAGGMVGDPDFDSTNGDADQFSLWVAVLRSASFDPDLPHAAATVVRESTGALLPWYDGLHQVLRRAADLVQGG